MCYNTYTLTYAGMYVYINRHVHTCWSKSKYQALVPQIRRTSLARHHWSKVPEEEHRQARLCVCMYVCMYVCVCPASLPLVKSTRGGTLPGSTVCMHACMHACMCVSGLITTGQKYQRRNIARLNCVYACMYACMYVMTSGERSVCSTAYIYIYIYIYTSIYTYLENGLF